MVGYYYRCRRVIISCVWSVFSVKVSDFLLFFLNVIHSEEKQKNSWRYSAECLDDPQLQNRILCMFSSFTDEYQKNLNHSNMESESHHNQADSNGQQENSTDVHLQMAQFFWRKQLKQFVFIWKISHHFFFLEFI